MDYTELISALNLSEIEIIATIINPVRKDEIYTKGTVRGFKPGLFGGGHSNWKKPKDAGCSMPQRYSSFDRHWIKKPKVLVVYNIFTWGDKEHSDWIDVDNCTFEIKTTK